MKHFHNTEKSKWLIGLATYLCAIKRYIKTEQIADESGIKVRLVVNFRFFGLNTPPFVCPDIYSTSIG